MRRNRVRAKGVRVVAVAALSAGIFVAVAGSSSADVTAVSGRAFGYYTNIGLFGGPPTVRGFGQTIPPGTPLSASPSVVLPSTGGNVSQTDPDGAIGTYGPANIFESPGPIVVSTQGTIGPGGSVTSSATVNGLPHGPFSAPPPGGVASTCTATETGVSGSATITNGILVLHDPDDSVSGEPGEEIVTPPVNPAPNTTYFGVIANVDNNFKIVFNEQIVDGTTISVNAVHQYALGPVAVGDFVTAQSQCGVTVAASTTTTTQPSGSTTTTTPVPSSTTTTAPPGSTTTTTSPPGSTTTTTTPVGTAGGGVSNDPGSGTNPGSPTRSALARTGSSLRAVGPAVVSFVLGLLLIGFGGPSATARPWPWNRRPRS